MYYPMGNSQEKRLCHVVKKAAHPGSQVNHVRRVVLLENRFCGISIHQVPIFGGQENLGRLTRFRVLIRDVSHGRVLVVKLICVCLKQDITQFWELRLSIGVLAKS